MHNSQRLLAILLVGASLSACTQFTLYRSQTPAVSPDDHRLELFECNVDGTLTETRELCQDPASSDPHAIQHRFYQSQDGQEGDYYLSFVEFDDQGWFAERRQMEALFRLLEELEEPDAGEARNGHTLIYVYAHGWKHNASSCDNNVVCFSRLLERTDLIEQQLAVLRSDAPERRTVVGVYVGWRGLPFKAGPLTNLSFWTRKEAAARVGRGGVLELLTRLKNYRDSRWDALEPPAPGPDAGDAEGPEGGPLVEESPFEDKTQLVITGHSFGGLVIYSALSHALMEGAAKIAETKDPEAGTDYAVAESYGDFVMLVNPAFEGSLYEPLFHITTNRCYDDREEPPREKQKPVMMIVTSEADSATGKAFPMGRTLGTLFRHAKGDQKKSLRRAIGHDDRYLTHSLRSGEDAQARPDKRECGCPYATATSEATLEELLGPALDAIIDKAIDPSSPDLYGTGLTLAAASSPRYPSRSYVASYPYLVVRTDGGVIADHNAIYSDRFITFAQTFFLYHIVGSEPWEKESGLPCFSTPCTMGGLVPCERSCQLVDNGGSCSGK